MNIIQKIVVGGAVFNKEGKLLIVQRAANETTFPNIWEIPGGSREPLEDCEATLVRELKEEAGIDVLPIEVFSSFNYSVKKADYIRDTTQIGFIAKLVSENEVVLSPEHQAFAWIHIDELGKYEITEQSQKVMRMAFKRAKQVREEGLI